MCQILKCSSFEILVSMQQLCSPSNYSYPTYGMPTSAESVCNVHGPTTPPQPQLYFFSNEPDGILPFPFKKKKRRSKAAISLLVNVVLFVSALALWPQIQQCYASTQQRRTNEMYVNSAAAFMVPALALALYLHGQNPHRSGPWLAAAAAGGVAAAYAVVMASPGFWCCFFRAATPDLSSGAWRAGSFLVMVVLCFAALESLHIPEEAKGHRHWARAEAAAAAAAAQQRPSMAFRMQKGLPPPPSHNSDNSFTVLPHSPLLQQQRPAGRRRQEPVSMR